MQDVLGYPRESESQLSREPRNQNFEWLNLKKAKSFDEEKAAEKDRRIYNSFLIPLIAFEHWKGFPQIAMIWFLNTPHTRS